MLKIKSWEVSDSFWKRVEPLIPKPERTVGKKYKRIIGGGRKPKDKRLIFEGIVYVLRTGCQWKALPKERYGSASSIHKYFMDWTNRGFFLNIWQAGLAEYDDLEGIAWGWQSIDGSMVKSPLGQEAVGPNPTDRGKNGTKRHLLVDEHGIPLSIVVTGANRHDVSQLENVLDNIVIARPDNVDQNLCADKGYAGEPADKIIRDHDLTPHVIQRGEEAKAIKDIPGYKARRWIVEVVHSWYNRFRKLLIRYEKYKRTYEALLHLASAIICWRKLGVIYG